MTDGNSRMGPGADLPKAIEDQLKRNERQFGVVYDLVAAGEINGLVGGLSGVYLNNTPIIDYNRYNQLRLRRATGAAVNGNTKQITAAGLFNGVSLDDGDRYLEFRGTGGAGSPGGVVTALASALAAGDTKVTINSSSFIADTHDKNVTGVRTPFLSDHVGYKIRITGAGLDGVQYIGIMTDIISATEATVFPPIPTAVNSGGAVFIDNVFKIASIQSTSTATLEGYTPSTSTNNSTVLLSAACTYYADKSDAVNYEHSYIDFRRGTRYQSPVEAVGTYDAPAASYMIAPNTPLTWYQGTGGKTLSPGKATGSAVFIRPSDFNFAQNVKDEIDRINISIDFPAGLRYISPKGNDGPAAVEFQVILNYKTDSSQSAFKKELITPNNYGGDNFIDNLHQALDNNGNESATKTSTYSWITAADFDHQDKIDDYFSNHDGFRASRRRGFATVVRRAQSAAFTYEFQIFLADRQPLHDWEIEIRRLTPSDANHYNPTLIDGMGAQFQGACNVKTVEAQIMDKFSYPTSAYAVVSYSAEDFPSPPKRAYRIQGRKVKVPTNYRTREETGTNLARYDRNITTGASGGTYQSWDGSFRGDQSLAATHVNFKKVYTDNPAWIFYDILTDKEIGLGEYIQESDIDIYSLYQIARYCDERVPTGRGGLEPRFTCNVYISSQTEAYKVLKDLASTFRAMLYWIDGEVVAVQDSPKEPVYSFTTGNVEEGLFTYTYTGQKARINQVNVTWNNPIEMYAKTVLTVEDTQNIESVGKIIPSDIVAFGCTSESQARRLADWHLSTAKNEGEVVSFTTGLNAAFLRPGDIINVQDKHRHGLEVSGRVSSGSNTIVINLDRTVTAPGGANLSDCKLLLIYTEPAVYLKQESATINSVNYTRGQLLLETASGGALVTQAQAANLVDDSSNAVLTDFSENSRVEVKSVTTSGTSASSLTVGSAFSSAPQQDTVWALTRNDDVNTDDVKEYRIIAMSEDAANKFTITASLYNKDKYDEIDVDIPVEVQTYVPRPRASDPVPAPFGLTFEQLPSSSTSKEGTGTSVSVVASWSAPLESFTDTNGTVTNIPYRFLSHFEIQHTFPTTTASYHGVDWTTVRNINGNATTINFSDVDAGTYSMRIRAINSEGTVSPWHEITREIFSIPPGTSRIARVPRGGFLTFSPEINAISGLVSIDATAYRYIHPSGEQYIFNPASTAQLQQDFSTLPAGQSAFWFFDASNTVDPFKTFQLHTDTVATDSTGNVSRFNYLKGIGGPNNGLQVITGTVTVAAGSTEVTGSGTSFTTAYYVGGFIKISDNSAPGTQVANSEYREIVSIESNTKLTVRNAFTRAFSAKSAMKQTHDVRFSDDAILAEVTRASSGSSPYSAEFYVQGKGAGGSDTVKTVHIFRTGTIPLEVPDPTATELGREPVEDDYVTIHYTDADVVLVYDGTGWGEEAEVIDGNLIREGTLPQDSIEEEATFDKINRLKNVYDLVNQSATTGRGQIVFRNSADNANSTVWGDVGKIKISTVDSNNKDRSAVFTKITKRTHIHIVEDVSDSAQDSGTIPSRAVFKATAGTSVGTSSTSSTITSVGYKSVKVYVSAVNNSILVGDTFSATGIMGLFSTPKVTRVQMSSSPYYVILSTSVPSWSGTRVGTFTRTQHTITVGNPLAGIGSPNYSGNYIIKLQVQSPSEVTTGETIVEGTVTGTALAASTVTGAKIAGSTIEAGNIVDGTITGGKIDSATISASNIVDGTITGTKIDSATITGSNMVNGTITGTKIDSATIAGSNIDSATITGSNIANTTITGGQIAGTTITGSKMVNGTITGTQIANATVTGGKIAGATITDANIASGTITGTRISASTISNSLLVDNTIQGGKIALATIQGGNIATNTITANNIVVTTLSSLSANIGAISSGSLQGGSVPDANTAPSGSETGSFFDLTLGKFVVGNASNYVWWSGTQLVIGGDVIATGNIQDDAISSAKMANDAVTSDTIAADAVVRAKIADNAINANKIASNAITASEIAANTITANQLTTGEFVTNTANISDAVITSAKIITLDADKISANTTFSNNLTVGSTFTVNSSGKMYSSGKTDFGNSTAGFFLGYSGGAYKFHLGDNTNYVKWDGSALTINGTLNITASEVSGLGNAATQDVSNIDIGDLDNAGTFKGGLSNLTNPGAPLTPIAASDVNGNVTSISGGVIQTGTLNASAIIATTLTLSSLNDVSIAGGANGNIGMGEEALDSINSGQYNIGIGYKAGTSTTSQSYNTYIGYEAGRSKYGSNNIAIGYQALREYGSAYQCVAIGSEAGRNIKANYGNTLVGYQAGEEMDGVSGSVNTAMGVQALQECDFGNLNTAIGYHAGRSVRTGIGNVFVGFGAGGTTGGSNSTGTTPSATTQDVVYGDSNVYIGRLARPTAGTYYGAATPGTVSSHYWDNCIAIGAYALGRGYNTAVIGSSSVTSIGGYANWSNHSDARDKFDITNLSLGLNLVNTLTPKKFKFNTRSKYKVVTVPDENKPEVYEETYDQEGFDNKTKASEDYSYGFLAQDVKEKVEALDSDPTTIVDEANEDELMLRMSELIPVLWKAVQELSTKNDALEARIATLEGG